MVYSLKGPKIPAELFPSFSLDFQINGLDDLCTHTTYKLGLHSSNKIIQEAGCELHNRSPFYFINTLNSIPFKLATIRFCSILAIFISGKIIFFILY